MLVDICERSWILFEFNLFPKVLPLVIYYFTDLFSYDDDQELLAFNAFVQSEFLISFGVARAFA